MFKNILLNLAKGKKHCNKINFAAAVLPQQESKILDYRAELFSVTFDDVFRFSVPQNLNLIFDPP